MNSKLYSPLIFEYSRTGRRGYMLPRCPFAQVDDIPTSLLRDLAADLPEVDEPTIVRHYTNLSTNNFGVDTGFYPWDRAP